MFFCKNIVYVLIIYNINITLCFLVGTVPHKVIKILRFVDEHMVVLWKTQDHLVL